MSKLKKERYYVRFWLRLIVVIRNTIATVLKVSVSLAMAYATLQLITLVGSLQNNFMVIGFSLYGITVLYEAHKAIWYPATSSDGLLKVWIAVLEVLNKLSGLK